MERNREARRGSMASMNGGLARRKQRSNGLRDFPEDDGDMEMHETTRLRDRGCKKDRDQDRDRDRSTRSKRRRGEQMLHGTRDGGDESWEESLDEEDEEDEEMAVRVRLQNPVNSPAEAPPLSQNHQHHIQHQQRKSFPVKPGAPWKPADEIGFSIPRKARSASVKRSHESWVSGGGVGGSAVGEQVQLQRQLSGSPSRLSPASAARISPTSSTSVRKMMKPMNGNKLRPPKILKSSSNNEEIEMEIAEVLFKLKKQEDQSYNIDAKPMSNEGKFQVSSPNSTSPPIAQHSNLNSNGASASVEAPRRKQPRAEKFQDESPTSPLNLLPSMSACSESISPKLENLVPSPANENGGALFNLPAQKTVSAPCVVKQEPEKIEDNPVPESMFSATEPNYGHREDEKKEVAMEARRTDLEEVTTIKVSPPAESLRGVKFTIDLMASPPGKSSPEREDFCNFLSDNKLPAHEIKQASKINIVKKEAEAPGKMVDQNGGKSLMEDKRAYKVAEKSIVEDIDSKKHMTRGKTLDLSLDLEILDNICNSKPQILKQQSKPSRVEPQSDKTVPSSLQMPMNLAVPGNFPPFGYGGQIPSLQAFVPSMNVSTGSSSVLQPQNIPAPPAQKRRCSTHCYIAQTIRYYQRTMQTNPLFGTKPPYNINAIPGALLGNPLQGSNPVRSMDSLQDIKGDPIVASSTGLATKDNLSIPNVKFTEADQRKNLVLHQMPSQVGSANNKVSPALFFPLDQHQAVQSGVAKSSPGVSNADPPSGASSGGARPVAAMNFGYAMPPNDAQYLAILQNNGYTFPISAQVGGPPSYRGGSPAQAMPFFGGPFYPPQMPHPSQLQQQHPMPTSTPQQPPLVHPGHRNASTSSDSSSSLKHQQRIHGGVSNVAELSSHSVKSTKQHLQTHQPRQLESETGFEDSPLTAAGNRVPQAQKSSYGRNEKQPTQQQQPAMNVDITTSQALAMSFATMNGGASSLQGLDFSSMVKYHAMFERLPEAAKHGYQMSLAAAATSTQQKKALPQVTEEERNMMVATSKASNLPSNVSKQFQLQKQAQELQHQNGSSLTKSPAPGNNGVVYSEQRPPSGSMSKFPQMMNSFPHGLVQGGSPSQSPQWKTTGRMGNPAPTPPADLSLGKNHLLHQQGRPQISFGANALKQAPAASSTEVASPTNSVSKSNGGSPGPSTSEKLGPPSSVPSSKSSASSSSRKPSPNRNAPSILGHPATSSSSSKPPPQSQQQYRMPPLMQKQHPQLFFSNVAYMQQAQPPGPATAGYYRQQQKQSSKLESSGILPLTSSGLSLAGSSVASDDPAKAVAGTANSMKGLPHPSLLHAAQLAAAAGPSDTTHPFMLAATTPIFPYMSMPSVSVKPGDQKPAAGNNNLHGCWQPEKRL